MPDALQMLRDDHKKVKDIFKQYEEADDAKTKQDLAKTAIMELEIHAELEEEIFYPALRKESDAEEVMMDEADEEHHVAKLLMAELRGMRSGTKMDAKFKVLAENVKHHIDEEESEMLPKAAELGMERMTELGQEMEQRKVQLLTGGKKPRRATSNRDGGRSRSRSGTMSNRSGTSTRKATARTGTSRTTAKRTTAKVTGAKSTPAGARTSMAKRATKTAARGRSAAARSSGGAAAKAKTAATRTRSAATKAAGRAKASATRK